MLIRNVKSAALVYCGRNPCHRQIHALFDNATLARELNCVERLRDEPRMQRFLAWVRKQDPDRRVKVRGGGRR